MTYHMTYHMTPRNETSRVLTHTVSLGAFTQNYTLHTPRLNISTCPHVIPVHCPTGQANWIATYTIYYSKNVSVPKDRCVWQYIKFHWKKTTVKSNECLSFLITKTFVHFVLKSDYFMLLWKAENHNAIHPNENQIIILVRRQYLHFMFNGFFFLLG